MDAGPLRASTSCLAVSTTAFFKSTYARGVDSSRSRTTCIAARPFAGTHRKVCNGSGRDDAATEFVC